MARHYQRQGHAIAARRWRSAAGEIDIVARSGDRVVFVEVKAGRTLEAAAWKLTPRQAARIAASAEIWLGDLPFGSWAEAQVDLALVDGAGQIEVIENVLAA